MATIFAKEIQPKEVCLVVNRRLPKYTVTIIENDSKGEHGGKKEFLVGLKEIKKKMVTKQQNVIG